MIGRIYQLSISNGGVPKVAVRKCRVLKAGLEGDWQHDRKHHGGPDRAVCLFSLEVIERLRAEGHPIGPGTAGENLTVSGLTWGHLVPGACLRIGSAGGDTDEENGVVLEIASYCEPCATIRDSFAALKFKRIDHELHPGESRVYARVLREGIVKMGDICRLDAPEASHFMQG